MLDRFAKMLGLPVRAAEDALHSEKLARAVLSRRGFIGGSLAMLATGTKMVPGSELGLPMLIYDARDITVTWDCIGIFTL